MLRKAGFIAGALMAFCALSVVAARALVSNAARDRTYSEVSQVPRRRVALVLGCPKQVSGWPNPFFENRIAAAAELYRNGKVEYLIVSGDNHIYSYDEPTDMKDGLVARGVPAERIYPDYAGFRTLDSVVRVKEVFGQEQITIVSQKFHNERAIFLARHHGIDAIGFNAPDVAMQYGAKTLLREQFAKAKAVLDVYVLRKQPHFLGQRMVVGEPGRAEERN